MKLRDSTAKYDTNFMDGPRPAATGAGTAGGHGCQALQENWQVARRGCLKSVFIHLCFISSEAKNNKKRSKKC